MTKVLEHAGSLSLWLDHSEEHKPLSRHLVKVAKEQRLDQQRGDAQRSMRGRQGCGKSAGGGVVSPCRFLRGCSLQLDLSLREHNNLLS